MGTSFHNTTGPGQNLAFGLAPIHPTNHSSTYSICHAKLEVLLPKDNLGSIRVLQKCDFKIIGENKDFAQGRGEETEEYIFRLDGEIQ